ncbi:F-box/FBD/LRR-repeat protein At1g13570-like [Solanum verrucosum]|uniref:F-box/FBD/LRR-repeat protein At1g13570-like n=1 Tax=Solanum verrucosum TaxID=315347 RepID=UPI0020D06566|nr:F-box/FBD/LRR-repeat protein At1g13570-like [Solanum verrucosum]
MSPCTRSKSTRDLSKSIISELPIGALHRILELMPIKYAARSSILSKHWRQLWFTQPNIVFDPLFFQYVSNTEDSTASVIHKLLLKHTGDILGFHLISEADTLTQSDVNQFIIFVSNHGIQKFTLKMANDEKYVLPDSIFTCATLTHLKLSRCIFMLPDGTQFPNLFSLQLEHSKIAGHRGLENNLNLPVLETMELRFCVDVDSVYLVSPKLENLSIISSYTITFRCFNVNPIFTIIKHLCLNGTSLEKLCLACVEVKLCQPLKLQSLKICNFKISLESIDCVVCLLRSSPNLSEIEIDEVVKVDEILNQRTELLSSHYLSTKKEHVNEALRLIQTMKLRKFKGSRTEMCLIRVIFSHSPNLERMIIEQCEKLGNATNYKEKLREQLSCITRASPKAIVVKYLQPVFPVAYYDFFV